MLVNIFSVSLKNNHLRILFNERLKILANIFSKLLIQQPSLFVSERVERVDTAGFARRKNACEKSDK